MIRSLNLCGVLFIVVAFICSGCGPEGPPPTAKAAGTVTHQGKPVPEGEIYFVAAEKGFSGNAPLSAEGKYQITENLPPASYKVFITAPRMTKPPMPGETQVAAKPFVVPQKYWSETSSGLTAEVKAGDNTFDFKVD